MSHSLELSGRDDFNEGHIIGFGLEVRALLWKLFCSLFLCHFQNEILELFHNGKRKKYFDLWNNSLPKALRDSDSVSQKLEFYLNIYFAVYPIKFGKGQVSWQRFRYIVSNANSGHNTVAVIKKCICNEFKYTVPQKVYSSNVNFIISQLNSMLWHVLESSL